MSEHESEFSPTLGRLAKALAKAQGELQNASKDAVNPHFKNKYATLASVREAITPVFSANGLSIVQLNEPHGDAGVCVVSLLIHESGEWIRSKLYVPVSKKDAQGFGSALSYARRYALAAIANIATDDDDDANTATKSPAPKESGTNVTKAAEPAKAPPVQGSVDVDALVKALKEAKDATQLAKASVAVGQAKAKLSKADLDRCHAAKNETLNRLAEEQAA